MKQKKNNINWIKEIVEYLIYWPFIVGFFTIFTVLTYINLRYKQPIYKITSSVLIKQGDKSKNPYMKGLDAMQNMGMVSIASNFDNEVIMLQAKTLIKRVVSDLGLYINYEEERTLNYTKNLYKQSPVEVWMPTKEASNMPTKLKLEMQCSPNGNVEVEASYFIKKDKRKIYRAFDRLPAVMVTPIGTVTLTLPKDTAQRIKNTTRKIIATIEQPQKTAKTFKKNLYGKPASKTTSIVLLTYKDIHPQRGVDFVNALVDAYNNDTNEDKNIVATKTAEFINDRIELINHELGSTESELAHFKKEAKLTDLHIDAQLMLKSNSEYEQRLIENSNQLRMIGFLKEYINNPKNVYEVIPVNVGLTDRGLTDIIAKYNEMLMERKNLMRISNENNPANLKIKTAIDLTRESIIATVESVESGLKIAEKNFNRIARKYENRISSTPHNEKELLSIQRQQEIKANLYLMLLEKREENAIKLATTANNGRIVEEVEASDTPIYPRKLIDMLFAMIMGIVIPVGMLWLRNLLKFRIEYRKDVEMITDAPIIADIPQFKANKHNHIVVRENNNSLSEEVFRGLRTNLKMMLKKDEKVIMFTSTIPGEGKSFTAANLATSFALMGKKTLMVGLDIRKPGLNKIFNISKRVEGITQYLCQPDETDLLSLCQQSEVSQNLYILPGGIIPPNPTELVSDEALDQAMEILRQEFDYIILDTAPIGLVTDTQIISRVADISVYVCRAEYTPKTKYELINEIIAEKKLPRVCTLINGINMNKRKNGYYYGYGKYGHYGKYGYGYGYGYGYHDKETE